MTSSDLEDRLGPALKSWAGHHHPSPGFADKVVTLARRRRARRRTLAVASASAAAGLAAVLAFALAPGTKPTSVRVVTPPTSAVPAPTVPVPSTTAGTTPPSTAPAATAHPTTTLAPTTTTAPRPAAGVLADSYHFHVNTMTISANGTGTASWRVFSASNLYSIAQATFHLTSVQGSAATGLVDTSTDPSAWVAPGQAFRLVLQPNDMLTVTPSGPFPPLCGSAASQAALGGHPPAGVNCGA